METNLYVDQQVVQVYVHIVVASVTKWWENVRSPKQWHQARPNPTTE